MTAAIVSSIDIYPIKSTVGISLSNTWVDQYGLSFDRRFVLTDHQGQFITARSKAKLCLIKASLTQVGLVLTAPDMPILIIKYDIMFVNCYLLLTYYYSLSNSNLRNYTTYYSLRLPIIKS